MKYLSAVLLSFCSLSVTAQSNTWIKCIHEKTYTIGNTNTGKAKTYHTGITVCYNKYAYCIITKDDKLTFTIDGYMQRKAAGDSCVIQEFINAADELHDRGDYGVTLHHGGEHGFILISYGKFGDYIDIDTKQLLSNSDQQVNRTVKKR